MPRSCLPPRSDVFERCRAVDVALKVLNTLSRKRNRQGPAFVHFGGAVVGDKTCLAWDIAAEYLNRLPPDLTLTPELQGQCAQTETLFMDDEGNVDSDLEKICQKACPERVVVVEGIGEATIERLELLLQRVTHDGGAGVCVKHSTLSLSKWVFLLVSELGQQLLGCPTSPDAYQTDVQVQDTVKKAVRESARLEALYGAKRATKSIIWKHGLKVVIPFRCLLQGESDTSKCAGGKRPVTLRARKDKSKDKKTHAAGAARGSHANEPAGSEQGVRGWWGRGRSGLDLSEGAQRAMIGGNSQKPASHEPCYIF